MSYLKFQNFERPPVCADGQENFENRGNISRYLPTGRQALTRFSGFVAKILEFQSTSVFVCILAVNSRTGSYITLDGSHANALTLYALNLKLLL